MQDSLAAVVQQAVELLEQQVLVALVLVALVLAALQVLGLSQTQALVWMS